MKIISLIVFIVLRVSLAEHTPRELRCLVCRVTVEEMLKRIEKVNPNKKIQIGGYRIDETGNLQEKLVPFARSGMHLSELMDEVCESMEDYVRATHKETGKLAVLKMIEDGKMNPELSNYDIIQDSDLNKSLGFYCESIVEEFEDDIYGELKQLTVDPVNTICTKASHLCEKMDKDEL